MKLNESDIRTLVLQPKMKEAVKRLMLSDHQIETLRLVGDNGLTSAEVCKKQGTSVQGASQLLKNIYSRGYMLRKELKSPSGGKEYAYWVKDEYMNYLGEWETLIMNRAQHLLTVLMEECCELAQDTAKAKRFGVYEQRDLPTSNRDRMQKEFNDILAVVDMLNDEFGLDLHRSPKLVNQKIQKVNKYLEYSDECGTLLK